MSGTSRDAAEARDALQHPSHDISAMTLALALGRRRAWRLLANPSVGAVIADSRSGRIISGAWTGRGGRPHGEAIALAAAGEAAHGATVYTTLEPCSHWGKTPPCADALVKAGIKRLVYGAVDPDPRVVGRGLAHLREHGIEVVLGPLPRRAEWLAIGHALRVTSGRPFMQLELALDADGRVPAGDGAPQFVTGEEARGFAYLLRAEADAILVGRGTVEADDPELTCRLPGLTDRSPIRVVLSSRAKLPLHAKMLRTIAADPVWIIHTAGAEAPQRAELERLGVVLIPVEAGADGRPDTRLAMQALAKRGITRVLAEGGPELAESLGAADLIDEALIFHAPSPSRGASIAPFGGASLATLEPRTGLHLCHEKLVGADRLSSTAAPNSAQEERMFTGIISDVGLVRGADRGRFRIGCSYDARLDRDRRLDHACDGCCLTVTRLDVDGDGATVFDVEASNETLSRTTLGKWRVGARINLERSLKAGDELRRHIVAGHVDSVAEIVSRGADRGIHAL